MPTLKTPPKITISGKYAYLKIGGKVKYLGKAETEAAERRYRSYLRENGFTVPPGEYLGFAKAVKKEPQKEPQTKPRHSVERLVNEYLKDREKRVNDTHKTDFQIAGNAMIHVFGDKDADKVEYKDMAALRDWLTFTKNKNGGQRARKYINALQTCAKAIFKWGRKRKFLTPGTLQEILEIEVLKPGETEAPEPEERQDVALEVIAKTKQFCSPIVSDMIEVCRLTAARPSEIFGLTWERIEADKEVSGLFWFTPKKHKNQNKNKARELPLFTATMEILNKYKHREPGTPIFSNRENHLYFLQQKRYARKTPVTPSQAKRDEIHRQSLANRVLDEFTKEQFYIYVQKGITAANEAGVKVEHWTPYQLRHTGITFYADPANGGSDELAKAIAGHGARTITDRYNHSQRKIIRDYARRLISGNFTGGEKHSEVDELKDEMKTLREQNTELIKLLTLQLAAKG